MGFEIVDRMAREGHQIKKVRVLAASVSMGAAWKAEGTVIAKTFRKKHV